MGSLPCLYFSDSHPRNFREEISACHFQPDSLSFTYQLKQEAILGFVRNIPYSIHQRRLEP